MYHIVPVDDDRLLRYIVKHIFHEWHYFLRNYYNVKNETELYDFYSGSTFVFYACLDDHGHFLGCFSLQKNDSTFILANVYVIPSMRGRSIGRTMIQYVLEHFDTVQLHCETYTVKFYEKFGFEVNNSYVIKGIDGIDKNMYIMKASNKPADITTPYMLYLMILVAISLIVVICWCN